MTAQELARFQILRLLEQRPELSQRQLADALGISLGKVNYLLNALVDKGLVKIGNFQRGGDKLNKIAYLLTADGLHRRMAMTRTYLERKTVEYQALKAELEELQAEVQAVTGEG